MQRQRSLRRHGPMARSTPTGKGIKGAGAKKSRRAGRNRAAPAGMIGTGRRNERGRGAARRAARIEGAPFSPPARHDAPARGPRAGGWQGNSKKKSARGRPSLDLNHLYVVCGRGPVAQLGWSVRLIRPPRRSKGREFESHSAHHTTPRLARHALVRSLHPLQDGSKIAGDKVRLYVRLFAHGPAQD